MGDASQHARLAPSAAHQWIACPGSIKLQEHGSLPKQLDSPYAREGSAAHALGELCLSEHTEPHQHIGRVMGEYSDFPVTEEMADAVKQYVDYVRLNVGENPAHAVLQLERRFDLSWVHPDIFGTGDAYIYRLDSRCLSSIDYKHGKGVSVSPVQNPQVMLYALGALQEIWAVRETLGFAPSATAFEMSPQVRIVIVQPRVYGESAVREWIIGSGDLYHWARHIAQPAAYEAASEHGMRKAGEHCRFCGALAICPEQANMQMEAAGVDFADPQLPAPEEITPEQAVKVVQLADLMNTWAGQVKEHMHRQMDAGVLYPGMKLVARRSTRKWVDEAAAAEALRVVLGNDRFTEPKLLSPAAAEKALKRKGGFNKESFAQLVHKPDTGTAVAPVTDPRKEVLSESARLLAENHPVMG